MGGNCTAGTNRSNGNQLWIQSVQMTCHPFLVKLAVLMLKCVNHCRLLIYRHRIYCPVIQVYQLITQSMLKCLNHCHLLSYRHRIYCQLIQVYQLMTHRLQIQTFQLTCWFGEVAGRYHLMKLLVVGRPLHFVT